MNNFDVIVIGSGIGGLSVASLLSQMAKKRVLVLERHFKLGGFTHSFSRKGYTWDVGLHYVGGMAPGSQGRQLFDLITRKGVTWQKLPDRFDKFVYPDQSFTVPSNVDEYLLDLMQKFPDEKVGLQRYFRDLKQVARGIGLELWRWSAPRWLQGPLSLATTKVRQLAQQTTQAVLDKHLNDEKLKALLASQWGDYGLPPSQSSFAAHALVTSSYFEGAWYPVGGASTIAKSIIPIIQETGGDCLVNHEVVQILLERGEAAGVKVKVKQGNTTTERTFTAPLIISDAGAFTTFTQLLPTGNDQLPFRQALERLTPHYTVVTLYLGFEENPGNFGFSGENHWLYSDYDHNTVISDFTDLQSQLRRVFLSFGSLNDPLSKRFTAQIITPIAHSALSQWVGTMWQQRGASYETLKLALSEALLSYVDSFYPDFSQRVAYSELSTPLTIESFTGNLRGAIYGIPATPEKFANHYFGVRTPTKQLLLTGTDACILGIQGALMGGVFAAAYALHPLRGFFQVLNAARHYSKTQF